MAEIVDDKSAHCVSFILDQLQVHRQKYETEPPPFFLGVNGIQGVGKTTLLSAIATILRSPPHCLPTVTLSIDDLYLTHAAQASLASSGPSNALIQRRGEPGTHDITLGISLFNALKAHQYAKIPAYDKSAFNGQGDRTDESTWEEVNVPGSVAKVRIVILEGWCVGFRALGSKELRRKWEDARESKQGTLWKHRLEDLEFVNDKLREYDTLTNSLDALIHIDAENNQYAYDWRLEQESALRASRGAGMTDEQVVEFVDGCTCAPERSLKTAAIPFVTDGKVAVNPGYELYSDTVRKGVFESNGGQLRLVVGKDRRVKRIIRL